MIPIQISGRDSVVDFDLPYAFHALTREGRSADHTTWKTALWVNFFMGGVASAIGYGLFFAAQYDPVGRQSSLIAKLALWGIGVAFSAAALLLGMHALTRGRLVLDRVRSELRFYRFWFSVAPFRRLPLDEIGTLYGREVHSPGANDEPGHTYQILVAKLRDGRSASIAIDSLPSIEIEIGRELGLDQRRVVAPTRYRASVS